jgi:hypothetical protein
MIAPPLALPHVDTKRADVDALAAAAAHAAHSAHATDQARAAAATSRAARHHVRSASSHGTRLDTYFFTNTGLVSKFGPQGHAVWQHQTEASWLTDANVADARAVTDHAMRRLSVQPSLHPYRLHAGGVPNMILATGERSLVVLDVHAGQSRFRVHLEDVPVSAPIVADFDHDGWNDVIVVTAQGVYGYSLHRSVGTQLFSLLTGVLLASLAIVFATKLRHYGAMVIGGGGSSAGSSAGSRARRADVGADESEESHGDGSSSSSSSSSPSTTSSSHAMSATSNAAAGATYVTADGIVRRGGYGAAVASGGWHVPRAAPRVGAYGGSV